MKEMEYNVSGYSFTNLQLYNDAKREAETVEYILANTDLSDQSKMIKLYHKLIERKTFKTIVGYSFLKELQEKILKEGVIAKDNLPSIPVELDIKKYHKLLDNMDQDREQKKKAAAEDYRIKLRNSRIISMALFAIIIIMFLISIFGDRSVFRDYKNEVLDEYSSWKEDLEAREKALDEREARLEQQENSQD
jgi:hypothetical protein